MLMETPNGI